MLARTVKTLADQSRHTMIAYSKHGDLWQLEDSAVDWEETLQSLSVLLHSGRGACLLSSIEKAVATLCELTDSDDSFDTILARALDLHQQHCQTYDAGSRHIVIWQETNLTSIVSHLPSYDFSPLYPMCGTARSRRRHRPRL